jgi:hypothetical protein
VKKEASDEHDHHGRQQRQNNEHDHIGERTEKITKPHNNMESIEEKSTALSGVHEY